MTERDCIGEGSVQRQSDIAATLSGNAARFILRLVAGGIEYPYVHAIRDNLDKIEGRSRISDMVAVGVGRGEVADGDGLARAQARFLGEYLRKQENVEAISRATVLKIVEGRSTPPPQRGKEEEPSKDWLNDFIRRAEDASTDELRERLAGVLAGEFRRPGSFSRTTLRLIAEMDAEVLQVFQTLLPLKVGSTIVRDPSWNSGSSLANAAMLEGMGLLSGSNGTMYRPVKLNANGDGMLCNRSAGMVARGGNAGQEIQVPILLLSRAGNEIASLMPEDDEKGGLRRAAELIPKNGLKEVFVGRRLDQGGKIRILRDEIVWKERS